MKTIFVPTDFSDVAHNATEYAANMAKDMNAALVLYHAYHFPTTISEVPVMVISPEELQQQNESLLKEEMKWIKANTGVDAIYKTSIGFAADEIPVQSKDADLIVVGMRGAGKHNEALIGGVAAALVRNSEKPLLVVPIEAKYKKPKTIVFAVDYNPSSNFDSINTLKEMKTTFSSKIMVLNVKSRMEEVHAGEAAGSIKLEEQISDVEHVYYFSAKENIVDGINDFVKEQNADIVAVVPHHYNFIEQLFHTSVSKKMAFHTHVPLLTLPDKIK